MDEPFYIEHGRARELHYRRGHQAEAERAYRNAIALGATDAWLGLGILLAAQRLRERDAEAAFRQAMALDDEELSTNAAVRLGCLLTRAERWDEARVCLAAAEHADEPAVAAYAALELAMLLAHDGDLGRAEPRLRVFVAWYGERWDVDLTTGRTWRFLRLFLLVAADPRTRGLWRRHRVWRGRLAHDLRFLQEKLHGTERAGNSTRAL